MFERFGEIYFSTVYPGVVKGWHIHKRMTLNYAVPVGMVKLVCYDDRADSPTRGEVQELHVGELNYALVTIPPLVWNGFKGEGTAPGARRQLRHDPPRPRRDRAPGPVRQRHPLRLVPQAWLTASLAEEVERYGWYHTLDLGDGVVTQGMFDHRPVRRPLHDPGRPVRACAASTWARWTASGRSRWSAAAPTRWWPRTSPTPTSWTGRRSGASEVEPTMDETKEDRFGLAHRALGSKVKRVERSVYELDTDLGRVRPRLLRGPAGPSQGPGHAPSSASTACCRGSAIICNPIMKFRFGRPAAAGRVRRHRRVPVVAAQRGRHGADDAGRRASSR